MSTEILDHALSKAFKTLQAEEVCEAYFVGESSHYLRFNSGKVRQSGLVRESSLRITLFRNDKVGIKKTASELQLGAMDQSQVESRVLQEIERLRILLASIPVDPFAVLPLKLASTEQILVGRLLQPHEIAEKILSPIGGEDFVGISASGQVKRCYWNSMSQRNVFQSDSFLVDYSLISSRKKAVTGSYAGSEWDDELYLKKISDDRLRRSILEEKTPVRLAPGKYRVFLTSGAISDLLDLLSYGSLSEGAIQRKQTWLRHLKTLERTLSPLVSLSDDLTHGLVPRFSDGGEVAPDRLELLKEGKLNAALCGKRTEKEFGVQSNGASESETPRSLSLAPGKLKEDDILSQLEDGLYLPALHYLNWSDLQDGRMTGMTRHAAFLVKNGKLHSGIEDLRFDESIFHIWGKGLMAVRDKAEWCPLNQTYVHRSVGGAFCPGMLIEEMNFPL